MAGLLLFTACQIKPPPTKVYETQALSALYRPDPRQPVVIDEKTFVIDARSAFEYTMAHLRGSIHLTWEEFSQRQFPWQGLLNEDLYFHTRRLARLGLSPKSQVVIIDEGLEGGGEAGRIAWMLLYLGVKDVQIAADNYFRVGWSNSLTVKQRSAVSSWKPRLLDSLMVNKETLSKTARQGVVIDVRSEREVQRQKEEPKLDRLRKKKVHFEPKEIPWGQFFTSRGRPNTGVVKTLRDLDIGKDQRIYVISQRGVRSAAVTVALLDLGYRNVANYPGGYDELLHSD